MKRNLLVAMLLCCSILFGCAKGQIVDQEALAELQEEDEITYEDWKAQEEKKLDEIGKEIQKEYEEWYSENDGIFKDFYVDEEDEASRGMTYENFELIGTVDYMTVSSIDKLLDCKGKLVSEYGSYTVYQWEDDDFKIITVSFESGIEIGKSQIGL